MVGSVIITAQELHFSNIIFSLIQASLVQPNVAMTHLSPFNQILLPVHIPHVHSLIIKPLGC